MPSPCPQNTDSADCAMKGWFDAFREHGGPTMYSSSNRTPVTVDISTITYSIAFIAIYIAFLLIVPGIRKQKWTTFASVTLTLFSGAVILVCNYGSGWHTAVANIGSSYRAFSKDKIFAEIGVNVGLSSVNVTLRALPIHNGSEEIDYNERFEWVAPDDLREAYRLALRKGLPYPILTVAEYFAVDSEGFCWGREYRQAGYFTGICLWAAFSIWLLMLLLFSVVPRYGAYSMFSTGALMLLANLTFHYYLPWRPLAIPFEHATLTFSYGWSFWLNLITGILMASAGSVISVMDWIYPHQFSTIIEVDFDTPHDRHIIIEENDRVKRKARLPSLEEPLQYVGSRIWKRVSSKKKEEPKVDVRQGMDNSAFEMEHPKPAWKHGSLNDGIHKLGKSVSFRGDSNKKQYTIPERPNVDGASAMQIDVCHGGVSPKSELGIAESDNGSELPNKPSNTCGGTVRNEETPRSALPTCSQGSKILFNYEKYGDCHNLPPDRRISLESALHKKKLQESNRRRSDDISQRKVDLDPW